MKKSILFAAVLFANIYLFAQSPQSVPYQAVARDASGNLLVNQQICVQFTVKQGAGNTVVYQEYQGATTNKLGLFTMNLNSAASHIEQGSFSNINWSGGGVEQLQVDLDLSGPCTGSNTFTTMGTSPIQSVPYAISAGYANSAASSVTSPLSGNGTAASPLAVGYDNATIKVSGGNLYAVNTGTVTGTGSANYDAYWTSASALTYGPVYESATKIGVGSTTLTGLVNVGSSAQFQVDASGDISTIGTLGVAKSGSGSNIAATLSASGGTTNYALIVPSGGGNVGIGNSAPNAQAILDLSNTSNYALVLPQIATTSAPSSPTAGMTFYNSTTNCLQYYNGSAWVNVVTSGGPTTTVPTWVTNPNVTCPNTATTYVFNSVSGASYQITLTGTGNTVNSTNATVTPLVVTATAATTTLTVNLTTSATLSVNVLGCPGNNQQLTQAISPYGNNVMDVNSNNVTTLTTTAANEIIFIDYETYNSNAVSTAPTVRGSTTGVTNFWTSGAGCNSSMRHYDWYYLAATAGAYALGDAGNLSSNWAIGNVAVKNTCGLALTAANIHYGTGTGWNVTNCGNWVYITTNSVLPVGAFLCAATGDDGSSCGSGEANIAPQIGGFNIYQAECDGDGNNETIGGVTITSAAAQSLEISNTSQKGAGWQMNLWWVQYP